MDVRRANQIANTLEQGVLSGDYRDGDRLDEVKLATQFEVSRTPIREALQVLVASGMAEQIPRRGVFVRQPGPVDLIEMFETMAELEAACGRLAASRMTDQGLAELSAANDQCAQALHAQNPDQYYAANETFHRVIYSAAGNSYLQKLALQLQNKLKAYRRIQLRVRGRLSQSMDEHTAILEALRNADADQAADTLRTHVAVQGEKFGQLMASLKR